MTGRKPFLRRRDLRSAVGAILGDFAVRLSIVEDEFEKREKEREKTFKGSKSTREAMNGGMKLMARDGEEGGKRGRGPSRELARLSKFRSRALRPPSGCVDFLACGYRSTIFKLRDWHRAPAPRL